MNTIRVHSLNPSDAVLLLVDFVNPLNFDGADRLHASALAAASQTARLRRRFSAAGLRTVFANDNYGLWDTDFKSLWKSCAARRGPSGQIATILRPRAKDFALLKPRHSGFYATPLHILLQQLECKKVVVTGIAADSCVLFTAMDAYLRGYAVWVPVDCVAAETREARDKALDQMARVMKADTRPSTDSEVLSAR